MKWGYNDGKPNGKRKAAELSEEAYSLDDKRKALRAEYEKLTEEKTLTDSIVKQLNDQLNSDRISGNQMSDREWQTTYKLLKSYSEKSKKLNNQIESKKAEYERINSDYLDKQTQALNADPRMNRKPY